MYYDPAVTLAKQSSTLLAFDSIASPVPLSRRYITMSRSIQKLVRLSQSHNNTNLAQTLRSFHATPAVATTIVCVRKNGKVCMMGDGMVSQGSIIVKPNAVKIRRILPKGTTDKDKANQGTIVGFAGSTADAFTLLERLEGKLDEYPGQLKRSCVELAKGWRTDKYLRRLEASLIVADASSSLELTGNGDVLESHDGILGVGSGSPYAIGKIDYWGLMLSDAVRCLFLTPPHCLLRMPFFQLPPVRSLIFLTSVPKRLPPRQWV